VERQAHRRANKKRLLRSLGREIVVDVDEQNSEVILLIHWKGGIHTPLRLPRRRRGQNNSQTPRDVIEAVRSLARTCGDQMMRAPAHDGRDSEMMADTIPAA
jgi:hypothetical protein